MKRVDVVTTLTKHDVPVLADPNVTYVVRPHRGASYTIELTDKRG